MSSRGARTSRPERPIGGAFANAQPMPVADVGRRGEGVSDRCCGETAAAAAWI